VVEAKLSSQDGMEVAGEIRDELVELQSNEEGTVVAGLLK
jgi:hypothetical protein